jgi:sarcosine oxidase/sarcosine oxidase subunit beta
MAATAVVVGAGIGGLSAARSLAKAGWRVTVVEQGAIPNAVATSFDEHRIIRHAYGPHAGYGRLMPQAFAAWDRLFDDLGERFLVETGAIFALRGDDLWARESAAVMAGTGAVIRPLPLDALARRLPMLAVDGVEAAFETEGDGILLAGRILRALVMALARSGVGLRPATRVLDVDAERGRVRTTAGVIDADHVVVAAGAWAPRLLPGLAGTLVPSRQVVLYLAPPARYAEAWTTAPVIVDFAGADGTYAIPPRAGTRLKLGDHVFTMAGDPDDDRTVRPGELDRLLAAASASFRGFADYAVLEAKTCFYTVRDGERFLVRRIGGRGTLVSACSGHGFKFAPLTGEAVADAITGARDPDAVERWAAGGG